MGRLRRSRTKHTAGHRKEQKTKRKTKDLDQLYDDCKPERAEKLQNQEIDYDLPGKGQHYCVPCGRYFIDAPSLEHHTLSKQHKKQTKKLDEEPYRGPDVIIDNGKPLLRSVVNTEAAIGDS